MANTLFSHEDMVLKEAEGGIMFGTTFMSWDKVEQMTNKLRSRREQAQAEADKNGGEVTNHPDPVVLPPVGGPVSGGDPRAYPDPARRAAEGDELAINEQEARGPGNLRARPAVDHLPEGHGPADEQLAAARTKTQAVRGVTENVPGTSDRTKDKDKK